MSLKHTLKKFHLRNIEQIKLRRVETQNGERQYTSTVIIKFGYPVIVSHFQLVRTAKQEHPFEFGHIEGNLLGDFVDYERFLGTRLVGKAKRDTRHDGKAVAMEVLNFEASGVGEIVNLTFTMKRTFYHECRKYCLGKMGLSGEYAFSDEKENQLQSLTRKKVREEFRNYFYSITFYGISSAKSIKPFVGMLLINLGLRFRKHEMFLSENEVQLATALALTNEKKLVQATELLKNSVRFLESCAQGVSGHLSQVKKAELSFHALQKLWKQVSGIRFRCAMLSLLMSSINLHDNSRAKLQTEFLIEAISFYRRSKRQGNGSRALLESSYSMLNNGDRYATTLQILPEVVQLLSKVVKAEEAKYFKIAAFQLSNHFLLKYGGSLAENLIDIFQIMLSFLSRNCRYGLYLPPKPEASDEGSSSLQKGLLASEAFQKIANVQRDNAKLQKIFETGIFEIENYEDPYISTTPVLFSNVNSFLRNTLGLLPSLSADLLHQIFEMLLESHCIENLELPQAIRLKLIRIVQKIMAICQADLCFTPEQLRRVVQVQTLLHNKDYRKRVVSLASDSVEDPLLSKKEVYSLHLSELEDEELALFREEYSSLFNTIKGKYLFLVGAPQGALFLGKIADRLRAIADELEDQVLTEEFRGLTLEIFYNEQLNLGDIKFEGLGLSNEEAKRPSKNDLIKSKVEYLRNFRDLFGEFEYYLEIIDCLAANFSDRKSQKSPSPSSKMTDPDIKSGGEGSPRGEETSKKLIKLHLGNGSASESMLSLEVDHWDSLKDIIDNLVRYLTIYMRDSFFIDYFISTWVILLNFVGLLSEKRSETVSSMCSQIFKDVDLESEATFPEEHVICCLLNLFEFLQKGKEVTVFEVSLSRRLTIFMRRTFLHLSHNHQPHIFKLCAVFLDLFRHELTLQDLLLLLNSLKDPVLDSGSSDFEKLTSKILEVLIFKSSPEDLRGFLKCLVDNESSPSKNINKIKREEILNRRRARHSQQSSQQSHHNQQQQQQQQGAGGGIGGMKIHLKVQTELFLQRRIRKMVILQHFWAQCPLEFILEELSVPKDRKDIFESEEDVSLYRFVVTGIEHGDDSLREHVLLALKSLVSRANTLFDSFKLQNSGVTPSTLKITRFAYRLLLEMASLKDLRPKIIHDLLVQAMGLFSRCCGVCRFQEEVNLFNDSESMRTLMLSTKTSFLGRGNPSSILKSDKNPGEDEGKDEETNLRYLDITCFDSLENFFINKSMIRFDDVNYINVRLYEMFKLYMLLKQWVESPWSSIRGLVCNFISYIVPCTSKVLDECLVELMDQEVGSLLRKLISSKDSEAVISGLNILGAFCGFGQEMTATQKHSRLQTGTVVVNLEDKFSFFTRNSKLVPISAWERIYQKQYSWDDTIQIAAIILCQMALPKEYKKFIQKKNEENKRGCVSGAGQTELSVSIDSKRLVPPEKTGLRSSEEEPVTLPSTKDRNFDERRSMNTSERNLEKILNALNNTGVYTTKSEKKALESVKNSLESSIEDQSCWMLKKLENSEILKLISIFRLNFCEQESTWLVQQYDEGRISMKWVNNGESEIQKTGKDTSYEQQALRGGEGMGGDLQVLEEIPEVVSSEDLSLDFLSVQSLKEKSGGLMADPQEHQQAQEDTEMVIFRDQFPLEEVETSPKEEMEPISPKNRVEEGLEELIVIEPFSDTQNSQINYPNIQLQGERNGKSGSSSYHSTSPTGRGDNPLGPENDQKGLAKKSLLEEAAYYEGQKEVTGKTHHQQFQQQQIQESNLNNSTSNTTPNYPFQGSYLHSQNKQVPASIHSEIFGDRNINTTATSSKHQQQKSQDLGGIVKNEQFQNQELAPKEQTHIPHSYSKDSNIDFIEKYHQLQNQQRNRENSSSSTSTPKEAPKNRENIHQFGFGRPIREKLESQVIRSAIQQIEKLRETSNEKNRQKKSKNSSFKERNPLKQSYSPKNRNAAGLQKQNKVISQERKSRVNSNAHSPRQQHNQLQQHLQQQQQQQSTPQILDDFYKPPHKKTTSNNTTSREKAKLKRNGGSGTISASSNRTNESKKRTSSKKVRTKRKAAGNPNMANSKNKNREATKSSSNLYKNDIMSKFMQDSLQKSKLRSSCKEGSSSAGLSGRFIDKFVMQEVQKSQKQPASRSKKEKYDQATSLRKSNIGLMLKGHYIKPRFNKKDGRLHGNTRKSPSRTMKRESNLGYNFSSGKIGKRDITSTQQASNPRVNLTDNHLYSSQKSSLNSSSNNLKFRSIKQKILQKKKKNKTISGQEMHYQSNLKQYSSNNPPSSKIRTNSNKINNLIPNSEDFHNSEQGLYSIKSKLLSRVNKKIASRRKLPGIRYSRRIRVNFLVQRVTKECQFGIGID